VAADSEDIVILACTVLIQSQSVMDRQTNTDRGVARKKLGAVLNFARFDSLVCIVAGSREKSRSLSLVQFLARYLALSLSLTGLHTGENLNAFGWQLITHLQVSLNSFIASGWRGWLVDVVSLRHRVAKGEITRAPVARDNGPYCLAHTCSLRLTVSKINVNVVTYLYTYTVPI